MPTYSYSCTACGHTLEAFQKITDGALSECPNCGEAALERGIGGGEATFQFQGEGFYVNDYKKGHSCGCGKSTGCCSSKNEE